MRSICTWRPGTTSCPRMRLRGSVERRSAIASAGRALVGIKRTAALASLLSRGLPDDLDNVIQTSNGHHSERASWEIRYFENLLSEVLEELSEVARAEVKMTIPEKTYFQDDTKRARCVVKVWTWSGEPLDSNVRSATPYLLNRFVEDFGPETVTVLENPEDQ